MFDYLKEQYMEESFYAAVESGVLNNDDLKDTFLDDPDVMTMGAEDDPEINKLIAKIPEDDEGDEPTEAEIDELTEACGSKKSSSEVYDVDGIIEDDDDEDDDDEDDDDEDDDDEIDEGCVKEFEDIY